MGMVIVVCLIGSAIAGWEAVASNPETETQLRQAILCGWVSVALAALALIGALA